MTKRENLPVGFYDSGVGGVGVLKETFKLAPNENFIYYGDNANAPYGGREEEEIRKLSLACGDFLYDKGVKMIVIACNTATSIVVKTMREKYNIPVISMEPAVRPAAERFPAGKIAVLATPATLRQKRYGALLDRLGVADRVLTIDCGGLAELVERGDLKDPAITDFIYRRLKDFRNEAVCAVVLGCTHYSFIGRQIQRAAKDVFGGRCAQFDGVYGTARQVARVLAEEKMLSNRTEEGSTAFYSSAGSDAAMLLQRFYRAENPDFLSEREYSAR
jgi:glutamate racemase